MLRRKAEGDVSTLSLTLAAQHDAGMAEKSEEIWSRHSERNEMESTTRRSIVYQSVSHELKASKVSEANSN